MSATVGAPVQLFANGVLVGQAIVGQNAQLQITTADLQPGTYSFTAVALDLAGNVSSVSNSYQLTITGPAGSTGGAASGGGLTESDANHTLVGGAGADTLTAIHGGDTMTGGGGADHFAFQALPWSSSEITDFTPGADKLDLSALLRASGYAGADPIADGYVKLIDNGSGGTWVYYDTDGHGSSDAWGTFVATLDHVGPGSITAADLVGGAASGSTGGGSPGGGSTGGGTTGGSSGTGVTESGSNHTLVGGAGADTLTAIHGGDTMTGAGGADHFAFQALPWSSSEITDFTPGADKLDVSALLRASGYAGSDPIADGYVKLIDNGSGGTWVYYDTDGHGSADPWGTFVATLDHVAPGAITAADLSGGSSSGASTGGGSTGGGSTAGQTLTASDSSRSLVGGAGDDTLVADHGPDTLTGNGGADHFVFQALPWSSSEITDFTPGADKLDLSALLHASSYTGSDPVADGYVRLIDNGSGGTWVYYDTDGHGSADRWGTFLATLDHVSPSSITATDIL